MKRRDFNCEALFKDYDIRITGGQARELGTLSSSTVERISSGMALLRERRMPTLLWHSPPCEEFALYRMGWKPEAVERHRLPDSGERT